MKALAEFVILFNDLVVLIILVVLFNDLVILVVLFNDLVVIFNDLAAFRAQNFA